MRTAYLAGPMTGFPQFNFPAFDTAAANLRSDGWDVISPAELDRADGFVETNCTGHEALTDTQRHRFAANDINALLRVEAIVLLPGWQKSTGATNESRIASWLGKEAFEYTNDDDELIREIDLTEKWSSTKPARNARADILLGAEELVNGDRNAQYGDPRQDFKRTATMWTAYLGTDIAPHDVAALMALLKVSRIRWSPGKQDSWVDLAGYAACGWDCASEEAPT